MQKISALLLVLFLTASVNFAQPKQGTVEMDAIAFVRDSGKIQVEIYYSIVQGSLLFKEKGNSWAAQIDARAEIWHDGKVIAADDIKKEKIFNGSKAALDAAGSSLLLDGTALSGNIKSNDEAVLIFHSLKANGTTTSDTIKRNFFAPVVDKTKLFLGGIELASALEKTSDERNPFEKVGFIITPNPSRVFGSTNSKLNYYTELYVPPQSISSSSTCTVVTRVLDGQKHEMFSNSRVQSLAAQTVPLVGSIDIDGLPTDSYVLEIEVKSADKQTATMQMVFFYDSGMKLSEEDAGSSSSAVDEETIFSVSDLSKMAELELHEKGDQAMYIGTNEQEKAWKKLKKQIEADEEAEQEAAVDAKSEASKRKENDITSERRFLFGFWRTKDKEQGSSAPLLAYKAYYLRVEEANKKFTYQKTPGWETDFGRVFLKFGAPDERNVTAVLHPVDSKPYIVWQYNSRTIHTVSSERSSTEATQSVINYNYPTFIFVDRQGGGKFVLVHSNVQGETFEPDWYSQEASRTH